MNPVREGAAHGSSMTLIDGHETPGTQTGGSAHL